MFKDNIVKDFEKMRFSSNFETNISKNKMIFTISKMNYKKNTYDDKIFLYDKTELNRFKLSNSHKTYKFFNEHNIIYTTKSETIKKRTFTKIFIQGINARKPSKVFNIPLDIAKFYVLDKNRLLIISNEKIDKDAQECKYVIDRINFVSNGDGYTYNEISRAYIYDMNKNECRLITKNDETIEFVNVDKKSSKIFYITTKVQDVYEIYNTLYQYDLKTDENKEIYDKKDYEIGACYQIKGDLVVIASDLKKYGINENMQFYKLENNKLSLYVENEYCFGNSINSDIRYKTSSDIKQVDDTIYFLSTRVDKSSIYMLKDGNVELFFDDIKVVDDFLLLDNELIICGFDGVKMQEIYSYPITKENDNIIIDKKYKKITDFSSKFEKQISNYKVDEFTFESNKDTINGYVVYPKDYDKSKKYPAVLMIHGGPKTVYSSNFSYDTYALSQSGYFVIYTNPHGSDGFDNKFADIRGKYADIDYDDIMNFTDIVLEKYSSIEKDRLAVMGGSYGGYMTNYIVGVNHRFKTAITLRSISNWISFYGTSDIGYYFATDQQGCKFEPDKLWEKSPLKNVDNIKTPILILHSDEDYRCPLEQGVQLFTRLKINKVKTKMIIYKGENHDLCRSGKVQTRVSRIMDILDWFKETL
jgi:dipeptidyl aminopeptidase/acylaminoacyl-peptidase